MATWSRRDLLRAGLALSGGAMLTACGADAGGSGGGGASPGVKDLTGSALEDAARAEGAQLLWYNSGNPTLVDKVTQGFQKAYPWITLNGLSVNFSDLPAKVQTENVTNAPTADVIWMPPTLRANMVKNNIFTDIKLANDKNMPADTMDSTNIAHPVWQLATGIVYNPNVVTDPPATPQDLTDPKWKGQFAFDRVANLGQSTTWLAVWKGKMGDAAWNKWLDDLKGQNVFITPSAGAAYTAVLNGQVKIGLSSSNNILSQKPGTPMVMGFKIPPVPFYNHQYLTRRAAHPASAKVFMEWTSTAEGQAAVANAGLSPIMTIDHPNSLNKFLPPGVSMVPGTDLTDFSNNTDTYAAALSQRWPG